jgi:dodecin
MMAAPAGHRSIAGGLPFTEERTTMAESVYKVIELVGTSTESWEKAAAAAVNRAAKTLRDLRVAEVGQLDLQLENGKVKAYRAKVKVSFKYEPDKK